MNYPQIGAAGAKQITQIKTLWMLEFMQIAWVYPATN
jgi:hypothetical protein